MLYYTILITKNDEFILGTFKNVDSAIEVARDEEYYIVRDKRKNNRVEVREYEIDNEEYYDLNYDYSVIDYEHEREE